jgi:beta-glucosidase-like glycosyl hydrolase
MALDKDVQEAINKNLSKEVGTILQERLQKADQLELENAELKRNLEAAIATRNKLQELNQTAEALDKRRLLLNEKEAAIAMREAVVNLREKHADEKVSLMRGVVQDVFANSRLKYSETSSFPMQVSNGGYTTQVSTTRTGDQSIGP